MLAGFFNALSVVACILSCGALYSAVRVVILVQALLAAKPPLSASRIASIETSLSETQDTLKDLANKVKMQRVRTAIHHDTPQNDGPDPYKDPDAWRKQMNRNLLGRKPGQ